MRILFLNKRQYTNRDVLDDAYGRLWEFPTELAARGHDVQALLLSYRARAEGEWRRDGVCWQSVNGGPRRPDGLARYLRAVRAKVAAWAPDLIVASSDTVFPVIARAIAARRGIPVVADLYDNYESFASARLPFVPALYHGALRTAAGVVAVSQPLADKLVDIDGLDPERVSVVVNGINQGLFCPGARGAARRALGLPLATPLVGTAGSLFRNRNIGVLFDAVARAREIRPETKLVVAGPRDIEIPDEEWIIDLGVIGYDTVPDLFRALDVGAICNTPSPFGSYCFPQKAYEMIACGLPICAARVGALEGLLSDWPATLSAPDDARDLSAKILGQIASPCRPELPVASWSSLTGRLESFLIDAAGRGAR